MTSRLVRQIAVLACVTIGASSLSSLAQGDAGFVDLAPVGNYAQPQLAWTRLDCPQGSFVTGATVKQGGWLARVTIECRRPLATGAWSQAPTWTSSVGGNGGYKMHDTTLSCSASSYVTALSGLTTTVHRLLPIATEQFLADPQFTCSNGGGVQFGMLRDAQFRRELNSSDPFPTRYFDSPTQSCPKGMAASGAKVAVKQQNGDIRAIALRCATVPWMSKAVIAGQHLPVPPPSIDHQLPPTSGICTTNPTACATHNPPPVSPAICQRHPELCHGTPN